jgi:Xaa-Pro dipeptidase
MNAAEGQGNADRARSIRAALQREGLDALVCRLSEHVLFLGGYWPLCGTIYYVMPREGRAVCILPDTELEEASRDLWDAECLPYPSGTTASGDPLREIARRLGVLGTGWRRVGYEGNFEQVAAAGNAAEAYIPAAGSRALLAEVFGADALVDATGLLTAARACKNGYEISRIRTANEIACLGLARFAELVVPGASAVEMAAAVESSIMVEATLAGKAGRVRAFAQVAVGAEETSRAWRPAEITTARRLREGEIALLELAVVADGYWSDRTRPRVAGKPTARQIEVTDAVRRAQASAIDAAIAGASASAVDAAARRVMDDAGLEKEFLHITGHGTGFRYHEPVPLIAPGSTDVLRQGMIHSVEPGAYSAAFGGIRIEDDVLITGSGADILGPFSQELA